MCRRVTCDNCSKPGWVGCGAHIEAVLGDVDPADRCSCNDAARADRKSFLGRVFGN